MRPNPLLQWTTGIRPAKMGLNIAQAVARFDGESKFAHYFKRNPFNLDLGTPACAFQYYGELELSKKWNHRVCQNNL